MSATKNCTTRFSLAMTTEMRLRVQKAAKQFGTHESVIVKLAINDFLNALDKQNNSQPKK